jgi:hypothetical protein
MLSSFFDDTVAVRQYMHRIKAVPSRLQVLEFIDKGEWTTTRLDVYVPETAMDEMSSYLSEGESYTKEEDSVGRTYIGEVGT